MKRILVPTDFSSNARKALDYAVSIAHTAGAEILLLHVCELMRSPFLDQKHYIETQNSSKVTQLQTRLNTMKDTIEENDNVIVRTELYEGGVTASILEVIEQQRPDLLIMGTLGKATFMNKVFGSNTAAMLCQSTTPVIVVPFAYTGQQPKRILLSLNHAQESPSLLKPVFELADILHADVKTAIFSYAHEYALEVMDDSRTISDIRRKLSKTFNIDLRNFVHLTGDSFQEAVQKYMTANNFNLLAMVTHRAQHPQPLFSRSITKQMSYNISVPLLSIHVPR